MIGIDLYGFKRGFDEFMENKCQGLLYLKGNPRQHIVEKITILFIC